LVRLPLIKNQELQNRRCPPALDSGYWSPWIETGSFVRGAEALGLSDAGVSRAVARLEARLGVRQLERTTRSLRLTGEGGRFYAEAAPSSRTRRLRSPAPAERCVAG
jgi:hypothetical protein